MDLRCENGIKFAEMHDGAVEVKCRSRRCGAEPGVVVIHSFDALTGAQIGTRMFRDPGHRKDQHHAPDEHSAAVRSA